MKGAPDIIICLDSIAPDYKRMWLTPTVRGVMVMDLNVQVLEKGMHSGLGGGIVPDSFRVARSLISRIETYDSKTGEIRLPDLEVSITDDIMKATQKAADLLGTVGKEIPVLDKVQLLSSDPVQLLLNNTWRPTFAVLGADGLPPMKIAGNVLRPKTTLKLGFRLPPNLPASQALKTVTTKLTQSVPYSCDVTITNFDAKDGLVCPDLPQKTKDLLSKVSKQYFDGEDYGECGCGGSIGFMKMLQNAFPTSLFIMTGCAGQDSNAHGPNESLNLDYTKRFISALAYFLGEYTK